MFRQPLRLRAKQIYGIYTVFPSETPLVVKADLALLGSFAGALVGLPDSEVSHRLSETKMEELLRDAICEVFNVASAVVTMDGRAVFDTMITNRICISEAAEQILMKPFRQSHFECHRGRLPVWQIQCVLGFTVKL